MYKTYETLTYGSILKRMLDRILEANTNLDTREGSVIFDAIAPAAAELAIVYLELGAILDETFADTASREMLIKRAAERGITPEPATSAVLQGEFNIEVPIGSRYSLGSLNYRVLEKNQNDTYKMQCETPGTIGNQSFGALIPIEYIEGLETARLTELLIPGEDDEDTEHLRQRYFANLNSGAFGGNVADYKQKAGLIFGVGGVKVYPAWNGGGSVKLVITNSEHGVPSDALIDAVQTAIDPVPNRGKGTGIAPIGHVVTVTGATSTVVNIAAQITYQEGWSWDDVKPYAEQAIDEYLEELSSSWGEADSLIVRISQIEIRMLNLVGVVDISGTTINGLEKNLVLSTIKIPVRGEISG